jgi:FkbM family methyltransferase
MSRLQTEIKNKFYKSVYNHYGEENYDEYRFGKYPEKYKNRHSNTKLFKDKVRKTFGMRNAITENYFATVYEQILPYEERLERIYEQVSEQSKNTLIELLVYRMLGFEKVKLGPNNSDYHKAIKTVNALKDTKDYIESNFDSLKLHKYDMNTLGYDVKLYFNTPGIMTDFILEQYAYKENNTALVQAEQGDIVLDLGACWGDTAHYFASKVGASGKVYSFEFIPENIRLFKQNKEFNPSLKERINIVEHPVSDVSDVEVYFKDYGPASIMKMESFPEQTGSVKTICIDDFVERYEVEKVDFIKMDIEGAEPLALNGAIKTIQKFRPKLAIAIYHGMDDFTNIPNWILDLDLDYEIFIGHYTIHAEETVCFALPKS